MMVQKNPMDSRFPHADPLVVGDDRYGVQDVLTHLAPMVSEARQARIAEVVMQRTYTVVPVVEGLYDLGNVSAVMRTAEALGFQGFHVIESGIEFKESPRVTQGADKWLDVENWPSAGACVAGLKRRGYRIAVTHLEAAVPVQALDFTEPTALIFGNEAEGISEEMLALADVRCVVPMVGFVQSFNISVAAALALHQAFRDRMGRGGHGDLSEGERAVLAAVFYVRSVQHDAAILARLRADGVV